jgi:hypothetical protein
MSKTALITGAASSVSNRRNLSKKAVPKVSFAVTKTGLNLKRTFQNWQYILTFFAKPSVSEASLLT